MDSPFVEGSLKVWIASNKKSKGLQKVGFVGANCLSDASTKLGTEQCRCSPRMTNDTVSRGTIDERDEFWRPLVGF